VKNFIRKIRVISKTGIVGGRITYKAPKTRRGAEFRSGDIRKVAK
jgi:hypothetical protein